MTREEAIRWLEDIHRRFNPTGENLENEGGDVHLQALDMAIEALKEKNRSDSLVTDSSDVCKESESKLDLIRRSDAMGAVQDHFNADGFKGYDDGQKMMDRINALPSAETHDKRTETHGVCSDLISRQDAIDALGEEPYIWNDTEEEWAYRNAWVEHISAIKSLPSAEPQPKPISYIECANAMLKMWIDNVLTDGEYYRIMEKLNSKHMADMRGGDDE